MSNNPYPGVNAHINSLLQQRDGGWESFHAAHIMSIQRALNTSLPQHYFALPEKSLQISELGTTATQRTWPDIGVYQRQAAPRTPAAAATATHPTAILPSQETLDDEDDTLTAIGIYHMEAGQVPGRLVSRIEMLSPSNLPGGAHARYSLKRLQTLQSGINLIEIDYLHTHPPVIARLPAYPAGDTDATPYYVLVSTPQPSIEDGQVWLYAIAIDATLPNFVLPLLHDESILLDLGAIYADTLASVPAFALMVDLQKLPVQFNTYTQADQSRIRELLDLA